jgi:hypothetical protein
MKPLTPKIVSNDANENHKTNGHVHIQDESQPMITEQLFTTSICTCVENKNSTLHND